MPSRLCLRYQAIDFVLDDQPFVTGRTAECDLVLDDNLVSRRHASFRVVEGAVELTDLSSRNGVTVNGSAARGSVLLRTGDRVRIGSQELIVVDAGDAQRDAGTAELVRCAWCGGFLEAGLPCPTCRATVKVDPAALANTQVGAPNGIGLGSTALADKALSLGRFDEAERLLSNRLSAVLARVGAVANDTDREALKVATSYALKLAEGLLKPSWLDYPFDLYGGALVLMPSDTIEALYRVVARMRYANPHAVHRYVAGLRGASTNWDASERFLLQRLEGLERRIVSG